MQTCYKSEKGGEYSLTHVTVARGRFELLSADPKPCGGVRPPAVVDIPLTIAKVERVILDFWEYCRVEEGLSYEIAKDYKNADRSMCRAV